MNIPITPEITEWIEGCRKVMAESRVEFQTPFDPGFQQVMDAYDAEMAGRFIDNEYKLDVHGVMARRTSKEGMPIFCPAQWITKEQMKEMYPPIPENGAEQILKEAEDLYYKTHPGLRPYSES